jgi:putative ubiquitin-RnfH superfamily antitoxin RatB of RatAB toxin-antitoxin module
MTTPAIQVAVAYASPGEHLYRHLRLAPGSTVGEAIRASGLLAQCPEIDLNRNRVGIFGRLAQLDTPLQDGDRVEIYRPLNTDPKEARRRRAASAGKQRA